MEPVIKRDLGGSVSACHYVDETPVPGAELSDVTCTVYRPDGNLLIDETSITPATDGTMTMAISAEQAGTPYEWCRATFSYVYDGEEQNCNVYFHIARTSFEVPMHYDDLLNFAPAIADFSWTDDRKFARQRESALLELYSRLVNAGRKPWRVLNTSCLNIAFAFLWLSHIFSALSKSARDTFNERSIEFRNMYEKEFGRINIIEAEADSTDVSGEPALPLTRTKLRRG